MNKQEYSKIYSTFSGADLLVGFDGNVNPSVQYVEDDFKNRQLIMHMLVMNPDDLNYRTASTVTIMFANEFNNILYKDYGVVELIDRKLKVDIEDKQMDEMIFIYKYEIDGDFKKDKPDWLN